RVQTCALPICFHRPAGLYVLLCCSPLVVRETAATLTVLPSTRCVCVCLCVCLCVCVLGTTDISVATSAPLRPGGRDPEKRRKKNLTNKREPRKKKEGANRK